MSIAPDDTAPGMLLASIGFRVQPHKRAEVLSAVDETLRRMRQASGCARSRLLADADDPNAFTVLSEWQSAASGEHVLQFTRLSNLQGHSHPVARRAGDFSTMCGRE